MQNKNPQDTTCSAGLAEKEGFEPSRQSPQPTPLAGEPLTASWVLLHAVFGWVTLRRELAEREGFEPPVPCGITGFQDRLLKPLRHLSLSIVRGYYSNMIAKCQGVIRAPGRLASGDYYLLRRVLRGMRNNRRKPTRALRAATT